MNNVALCSSDGEKSTCGDRRCCPFWQSAKPFRLYRIYVILCQDILHGFRATVSCSAGGKNAEVIRTKYCVRRCHSCEFWFCLPGLLVPHLDRILFINVHMQRQRSKCNDTKDHTSTVDPIKWHFSFLCFTSLLLPRADWWAIMQTMTQLAD